MFVKLAIGRTINYNAIRETAITEAAGIFMEKVTVVIPNYNGMRFIYDCMSGLAAQEYRNFRVIMVDNGSEDGSALYAKELYPQLELICLDKNYGFSRAVNEGIRASKTDYVILLNNDTKAHPGYVGALVDIMEKNPRAFSASARMIKMYDKGRMDDAGDQYTVLGWAFQRGVDHPAKAYRRAVTVFSACAGAGIYRRSAFDQIGLFDEAHFAYLEDIDIGYRARIYGWQNLYCPRAVVEHAGSGTSGSKYNSFKVRLAARNNIYLNYKNMPLLQYVVNFPGILAGIIIKYAFFKRLGFEKDYRDGLAEGIRTCKGLKKVPFMPEHMKDYIDIELRLIAGTFTYTYEFLVRRAAKRND